MRNIIVSISEAAQAVAVDFRDACSRHFSLSIGGTMPGLFIKVPLLPLSAWVEWGRQQPVSVSPVAVRPTWSSSLAVSGECSR